MKFKFLLTLMFLLVLSSVTAQSLSKDVFEQYNNTTKEFLEKDVKLTYDVVNGDCFEVREELVCFKADKETELYFKEVEEGVKFGWQVRDNKTKSVIISSNANLEEIDFIDWSDMTEAGLNWYIDKQKLYILNADLNNGWIDPIITANEANAFRWNNQRHIIQINSTTKYAMVNDQGSTSCDLFKSDDSGDSWVEVGGNFNITITNYGCGSGSMILGNDNETIHAVFEDYQAGGDGFDDLVYAEWNTTSDKLITNLTTVNADDADDEVQKPDLAILNNGTIGVVWRNEDGAGASDIEFMSCSSNCGTLSNWSSRTIIADASADYNGELQSFPDITVNGTNWFVVWEGSSGVYPTELQIWYSYHNGTGWESGEAIDGDDAENHQTPVMIIKDNIPMVACTFQASGDTANSQAFSKKTGGVWSEWTKLVNGSAVLQNQTSPSLSHDGTNLHYVYSAQNLTGTIPYCVGYMNSSDDGNSWTTEDCITGSNESDDITYYPSLSYQYGRTSTWDVMLGYSNDTGVANPVVFETLANGTLAIPSYNVTASASGNFSVYEMTFQTYNLSLAWNNTNLTINYTNATFYWNDTAQVTTKTNNTLYSAFIDIGMGNYSVNTYWEYNWTHDNTSTFGFNTSTQTISAAYLNITNESGTGDKTQQLLLKDEDLDTYVNGTIEGTIFYQNANGNTSYQRNYSFTQNDFNISLYKNSGFTFLTNATIYYNAPDYTQKTYVFNNASWTNTSSDTTLYLTNSTGASIVIFTVTDLTGSRLPDSFIQIQKLDEGTGLYNLVEVLQTNYDGEAVSQSIVLYNETYKFIISRDGTVYQITSPTQIFRNSVTIAIDLGTSYSSSYNSISIASLMTVNSSRYVTWTYADTSGIFREACLKVWADQGTGRTWVCYDCVNTSSATLTCDGSTITAGKFTFNAEGWVDTNTTDSNWLIEQYQEYVNNAYELFGTQGVLASVLMIGTVGMIGLAISASTGIILTILGLIIVVIIGWVQLSTPTLIIISLLGAVLAYRIKN